MCALQTNLGVVSAVTPSEGPLQVCDDSSSEPAQAGRQAGSSARLALGRLRVWAAGRGCRWCVCARPGFLPGHSLARSLAWLVCVCVCLCVRLFVCVDRAERTWRSRARASLNIATSTCCSATRCQSPTAPRPGSPLPTSAPGPDTPLPTSAPGPDTPLPTSALGPGSPLPTSAPRPGSPLPTSAPRPDHSFASLVSNRTLVSITRPPRSSA
jgi:hypothetical protein